MKNINQLVFLRFLFIILSQILIFNNILIYGISPNIYLIFLIVFPLTFNKSLFYIYVFIAGLINDVVMGFPLGISSLSYLVIVFFGTYVRNKSVNTTIASDWFTFFVAMIFSNILFFSLLNNFSEITFTFSKISYNMFFTLFMFPVFWFLFNLYHLSFIGARNA